MLSRTVTIAILAALVLAGCDGGTDRETSGAKEAETTRSECSAIAEALGREGKLEGDVYRVGFARSDLRVVSDGVPVTPALALGSWVAFAGDAEDAQLMGDLVLLEREVQPVIERLRQGGIVVTAVHKHVPDERPAVWWTHVHGDGDSAQLAETIRAALELTATPLEQEAKAAGPTVPLDTGRLDEIIGAEGKADGGVYKFGIPLGQTVTHEGLELNPPLGVAHAIGFQRLPGGRALVNGDIVMTADEVAPVLSALTEHDIAVVSLHNHMLGEQPRLFFVHFWAKGDPRTLAEGLRDALDETDAELG